jgi:hypothetical protein
VVDLVAHQAQVQALVVPVVQAVVHVLILHSNQMQVEQLLHPARVVTAVLEILLVALFMAQVAAVVPVRLVPLELNLAVAVLVVMVHRAIHHGVQQHQQVKTSAAHTGTQVAVLVVRLQALAVVQPFRAVTAAVALFPRGHKIKF